MCGEWCHYYWWPVLILQYYTLTGGNTEGQPFTHFLRAAVEWFIIRILGKPRGSLLRKNSRREGFYKSTHFEVKTSVPSCSFAYISRLVRRREHKKKSFIRVGENSHIASHSCLSFD